MCQGKIKQLNFPPYYNQKQAGQIQRGGTGVSVWEVFGMRATEDEKNRENENA